MMQANELRVGNLVIYNVDAVEITGVTDEFPFVKQVTCDYLEWDEINPIQLTDEWLIKFGFKQNTSDIRYWQKKCLKIKKTENGYKFNFSESIIYIKSVHQLQNLYFSLTKNELKTN